MSSKRHRNERYSGSPNQGFDMNSIMNLLGGLGGLKGSSSRNDSIFNFNNNNSIDFNGNVSVEVENFMKALLPLMRSGYAKEIQRFVTLLENENIKKHEIVDKSE